MDTSPGYYDGEPLNDRLLAAIRAAGLEPSTRLAPESLAALDHFHSGGAAATDALLEMAGIDATTEVLDVGAGLAGPARLMADRAGCRVSCVDLSSEVCAAARMLNEITGLSGLVDVRAGDALDLPYPAATFDLVWMQNVSMGIPDKARLYQQARRVLRAGGRIALQDVVAGPVPGPLVLPVTWASEPSSSHLVGPADLRGLIEGAGFQVESWVDATDFSLGRPSRSDGALGYHVYVTDGEVKMRNTHRNRQDGRTALIWAVARDTSPR